MKICLIVEGCYPYVVGGVSAWVQMLMQRMPEHQFVNCIHRGGKPAAGAIPLPYPRQCDRSPGIFSG